MENERIIQEALVDRYLIRDLIGKGGMASVYKAIQINLNRPVALKVIHPNLVHDDEFTNRFLREAQVCASLNHPNIVTVYDVGTAGQVHYMSMEYLEGMTLREFIRSKGSLSVDDTVTCIAPIAEALSYIHRKGIVHRDVKSANIFITKEHRPVLMDFGIVFSEGRDTLSNDGSILGTPEYMSPEQAEGIVKIDGRSDIYSLGIILYECLTGRLPFTSDNYLSTLNKVIHDTPPSITSVNPHVPKWISSIVSSCLEKDRERRLTEGQHLARALRTKEKLKPQEVRKESPGNHSDSRYTRKFSKPTSVLPTESNRRKKNGLPVVFLIIILMTAIISAIFIVTDNFTSQPQGGGGGGSYSGVVTGTSYYGKSQPDTVPEIKEIISIDSTQLSSSAFNAYKKDTTATIKQDRETIRIENVRALVSEANRLFIQNSYTAAVMQFEQARLLAPEDTSVINGLRRVRETQIAVLVTEGNNLISERNYTQALNRFRSASSLAPQNAMISGLIHSTEEERRAYNDSIRLAEETLASANDLSLKLSDLPFETVRIDSPNGTYFLGRTEVTQNLWLEIMGTNPSFFKGINLPVENVSFNEIIRFITRLNNKYNLTFRLPTEAEWEFAARSEQPQSMRYSGSEILSEVAWYESNSGQTTHSVSTKRGNRLGIYDMSGNVWEWCSTVDATNRVLKGGAWMSTNTACSISNRLTMDPERKDFATGFRLCINGQ